MMNRSTTQPFALLSVILCIWLGWTALARAGDSAPSLLTWRTNYDAALAEAKKEDKLLFVDFHATWCGPCKMMDRSTFRNVMVVARPKDFIPLKIDVDSQPEVAGKYGVMPLPTLAVLRADGSPVGAAAGYRDASELLVFVDKMIATGSGAAPERSKYGIEGKAAPPLGVTTWINLPEEEASVDVENYRGDILYLCGFQSWSPGCHKVGFPTPTKLIERYKGDDRVAFIAVQTTFEGFSSNGPDDAQKAAKRYGLIIPVGQSGSAKERSAVMQRYRTGGTPWVVIIGPDGVVRYNDFHVTPEAAAGLIDSLLAQTLPTEP